FLACCSLWFLCLQLRKNGNEHVGDQLKCEHCVILPPNVFFLLFSRASEQLFHRLHGSCVGHSMPPTRGADAFTPAPTAGQGGPPARRPCTPAQAFFVLRPIAWQFAKAAWP